MTKKRATYGAEAFVGLAGTLPNPFPRTIGPNAMKYLQEIVGSGLTCNMPARFEKAFAEELGVKHCIAAPGCTPALGILAAALPFDPGDEIIVSPISDYGTYQGIIAKNLIPVFADSAPGTVNVSAETIEPCITERTRAILVVHKTGLLCDMDPINELASKHGLLVFEDACQAVFGEYKGRYAGTLGHAAAFSFDGEKTMGSDVGGCVVTNDDELAERIRFVGHSRGGVEEPGFGRKHIVAGTATRMPNCTAAICLAQLEIIHEQVAQRDKMIRLLSHLVGEIPGVTPLPIPDYVNVYSAWMFGMSIDPTQFTCSVREFGEQLKGIPGASAAQYYYIPESLTFLEDNARNKVYPYSLTSREYHYGTDTCPEAWKFVQNWIRWSTFCEKYTEEHCELAAHWICEVADANRKQSRSPHTYCAGS